MHYLTRSAVTLALMGAVAWLGDRGCDDWAGGTAPPVGCSVADERGVAPAARCMADRSSGSEVRIGAGGAATISYGVVAARGVGASRLCFARHAERDLPAERAVSLTRLMWRWRRTCAMRRRSAAAVAGRQGCADAGRCRTTGRVAVPAVRCSTEACGPVVLGTRRPVLVVPDGFFDTPGRRCVHSAGA